MTSLDRRRFIKLAATTAGAGIAAGILPPAILKALAIPPSLRSGTINDVEHVVILMQENRSFDHYFGRLRGVRGFGDPRPITLPSGLSVWHQPTGTAGSDYVLPFHSEADNPGLQHIEDLPHGWNDTQAALAHGRHDGWVPAKGAATMAYLERADIPFHYALADAFTVCDAYHCSIPASTDPNRLYLWTGWVGNDGRAGGPVLHNSPRAYDWTTYPERLEQAGIAWKIYQDIGHGLDAANDWGSSKDPHIGNYGDNSLLYFNAYQQAQPGSALHERARTGTHIAAADGNPDGLFELLKQDIHNGTLPQVSWIVAPQAFAEHPAWPSNHGAWYVSQVLEALTANPEVWSKTALFLTYDENDGFFDHVPPPFAPGLPADGMSTADTTGEWYDHGNHFVDGSFGLGPRVPMLVISPWSRGGFVCSQTFDHTSVIRFLETRFGVHEPNISDWRRAVCGDLTSAFDFSAPNAVVPELPDTAGWIPDRRKHARYHPVPPVEQQLPLQEPGLRPARPLPYAFDASGRVDPLGGRYWLDFSNTGAAGVSFMVIAGNRSDGSWSYTVEAGRNASDAWISAHSANAYDLSVHGPNGFLRVFKGHQPAANSAQPLPEARINQHRAGQGAGLADQLWITPENHGAQPCTFVVRANAYLDGPERHYTVPAGGAVDDIWNIEPSSHWYDLIVHVDSDATFERRFAGHVETGRPSISDPAFGGSHWLNAPASTPTGRLSAADARSIHGLRHGRTSNASGSSSSRSA